MYRIFLFLFLFLVNSIVINAQQRFNKEVNNLQELLKQDPFDINQSYFVRGYYTPGDGGGGQFVVTNSITFTNIGTRIKIPGRTYSVERIHDGRVSPRWFGAKGDGFTVDDHYVQAAIDYINLNSSFSLYPGSGSYLISATVFLCNNLSIIGEGPNSLFIFQSVETGFNSFINTNIFISKVNFGGSYAKGITFFSVTNAVVRDCIFTGANRIPGAGQIGAICADNSSSIVIDNNTFLDNGNNGSYIFDYAMIFGYNFPVINSKIINNHFRSKYSKYIISTFNCSSIEIAGNDIDQGNILFGTSSGYGIFAYSLAPHGGRGINIHDNIITNSAGIGIYAINHDEVSITKNFLYNTVLQQVNTNTFPSAILLNGCFNSSATYNTVSNAPLANAGIALVGGSQRCSIDNNWIYNTTNGIYSAGGDTNTITNNKIFNVKSSGIVAIENNITLIGNTISGATNGINLFTVTNSIITGNKIYGTTLNGINDFGGFNFIGANIINGGNAGLNLLGNNGVISPNIIINQLVGINIDFSATGYRIDPLNNINNNVTPLIDNGGGYIKTLVGNFTSPSVRDNINYNFNNSSLTLVTNFVDGISGAYRSFTTSNTNTILVNGALLTLDGATNYIMYPGDTLTFVKEFTGVWRQVSRSINIQWEDFDRSLNILNVRTKQIGFKQSVVSASEIDSNNYIHEVILSPYTPNSHIERVRGIGSTNDARNVQIDGSFNYVHQFSGGIKLTPFTLTNNVIDGHAGKVQYSVLTNNATYTLINFDTGVDVLLCVSNSAAFSPAFSGVTWSSGGSPTLPSNSVSFIEFLEYQGLVMGIVPVNNVVTTNAGGTVTIVDANGGVEISSGSPITTTGIVRGSELLNNQVGVTYTYDTSDRGKLVSHSNGGSIAGSLPQAGGAFPAGWYMEVQDRGAGTLTITPTISTIDGVSTLVLVTGQGAKIVSDGVNYFTKRGNGVPLPITLSNGGTHNQSFSDMFGGVVFTQNSGSKLVTDSAGNFQYNTNTGLSITRLLNNGQYLFLLGDGSIFFSEYFGNGIAYQNTNSFISFHKGFTISNDVGAIPLFRIDGTNNNVIIGGGSTGSSRTNDLLYIPGGNGPPTGIPLSQGSYAGLYYNFSADTLYGFNGGSWHLLGGGGASGNWYTSGSISNEFLDGNITINKGTSTNGWAVQGGTLLTANSLAFINAGGGAGVGNISPASGSHTDISGGTGPETYVTVKSGNITAGIWDTNHIYNAPYGITVQAGSSGVYANVGGTYANSTTSVGNIGGGEDNLIGVNILGGALSNNLDTVYFRCSGIFATNINTKEVRVRFGGTLAFDTGALAFNGGSWVMTIEIIRTGATGQLINVAWNSSNTLLVANASSITTALTLSNANACVITAQATTDNDVVQNSMTSRYERGQ